VLRSVERWEGCPYVIPNPATLKPWGNLHHQWSAVRKLAGLDGVRIHDLRHSFASNLVNSGRSIYEVGKLLGHSQVKTTRRYAHLSNTMLMSAMEEAANAVGSMWEDEKTRRRRARRHHTQLGGLGWVWCELLMGSGLHTDDCSWWDCNSHGDWIVTPRSNELSAQSSFGKPALRLIWCDRAGDERTFDFLRRGILDLREAQQPVEHFIEVSCYLDEDGVRLDSDFRSDTGKRPADMTHLAAGVPVLLEGWKIGPS